MNDSSDELNILTGDRPCIGCGYNLRGLQRSGRCPECNMAIVRSLRVRMLGDSDPGWLKAIRVGAITYAVCDLVAVGLLCGGVAYFVLPENVRPAQAIEPFLATLSNWYVSSALVGISLIGVWLMTRPEPDSMKLPSGRAGTHVRQSYVCVFIAGVISHFLAQYFVPDVYRAWGIVQNLLVILVSTLLPNYLSGLSEQLGEINLAGRFKTLRWLLPVSVIVCRMFPSLLHFFGLPLSNLRELSVFFVILEVGFLAICCWEAISVLQFALAIKRVLNTRETANH